MAMNYIWRNSFYNLSFICFALLACFSNASKPKNEGGFKGMFIFGTSVVDNGNNNDIIGTLAKANYPPYGIDFAAGITGRFSNGKNVADFIDEYLKLPMIPAFANPQTNGSTIIYGVNYGSGGSGILDDTGMVVVVCVYISVSHRSLESISSSSINVKPPQPISSNTSTSRDKGKVISLNEQIRNFEQVTLPQLETQLRCQRTDIILHKYLFLIAAGNNDYLLNYFLLRQNTTSPQAFTAQIISTYSDQIKRLYMLGARKFLVISVYPLGCSPVVSKGQGCLPGPNAVITMFYDQLITMVDHIKSQMPGSEIIVLNSGKIILDVINNPGSTEISNVSDPCCEVSMNGLSCKANGSVCDNRRSYAYFDGQHTTESLSAILATKAITSRDRSEVYPFNLHELALKSSKF